MSSSEGGYRKSKLSRMAASFWALELFPEGTSSLSSCKEITDGDRDVGTLVFWNVCRDWVSDSRCSRGEYLCSELDMWLGVLSLSEARISRSSA